MNYPNSIVGTAFAVRANGRAFLITNAHLCVGELGTPPTVEIENQKTNTRFLAATLAVDVEHDLCILSAPFTPTPLGPQFAQVPAILVAFGIDDETDGRLPGHTYVTAGHPGGGPLVFQSFVDVGDDSITFHRFDSAFCSLAMTQKSYPKEIKAACEITYQEMVLSSACLPGRSGSPIINENGQLVGIVEGIDPSKNTCYAVYPSHLMHLLREVLER